MHVNSQTMYKLVFHAEEDDILKIKWPLLKMENGIPNNSVAKIL